MNGVFLIWQEEGGVEHIMDGPRGGEVQLIRHWGYFFSDMEGTMTFRGKLCGLIGKTEVFCV